MLQKIIQVAAILTLLTGTASAQGVNLLPGERRVTPEDAAREKALEGEYQSAVGKIPDKKAPADPWGTVRPKTDASDSKQKRH